MSMRLISVDSEESVERRGEDMVTTAHRGCRPATGRHWETCSGLREAAHCIVASDGQTCRRCLMA